MNFYTSDTHWGHENVITYCSRPFSSVEEMNEELVKRWNEVVSSGDTVWHLGDFSLSLQAVKDFLPRLNGSVGLIFGNHDQPYRKPAKFIPIYRELGFIEVLPFHQVQIGKYPVILSHLYYNCDQERVSRLFHPPDSGLWHLHGHRHSPPDQILGNRELDVGCDGHNYYPWSEDEILEVINNAT